MNQESNLMVDIQIKFISHQNQSNMALQYIFLVNHYQDMSYGTNLTIKQQNKAKRMQRKVMN